MKKKDELVDVRRSGHKILYKLKQDSSVTPEMVEAGLLPIRIGNWIPYLLTKRELKKIHNLDKDTKDWIKSLVERVKKNTEPLFYYIRKSDDVEEILSLKMSPSQIIEKIEKIASDMNHIQVLKVLTQFECLELCVDCLNQRRGFYRLIYDLENGEYSCSKCGTVLIREPLIIEEHSHLSAFPPPN